MHSTGILVLAAALLAACSPAVPAPTPPPPPALRADAGAIVETFADAGTCSEPLAAELRVDGSVVRLVVKNGPDRAVDVPTAYDAVDVVVRARSLVLYRVGGGVLQTRVPLAPCAAREIVALPIAEIFGPAPGWRWDWRLRSKPPRSPAEGAPTVDLDAVVTVSGRPIGTPIATVRVGAVP